LRNQELKQAGIKRKQVWRPKDRPDGSGRSAPECMVYFLPNEASGDQEKAGVASKR
jgi:hypothetical protein